VTGIALRRAAGTVLTAAIAILGTPGAARAASTIVVRPGDSIQAAVDQANPGDTILVEPGTYTEAGRPCPTELGELCAVVVSKDGISLLGKPVPGHPVLLENPGGQDQGIAVAKSADPACLTDATQRVQGSTVSGFTVDDFGGYGVFLYCVDHWRITRTTTRDDLEYGIFPSHSGFGRVDNSFASGAQDTGIYVGQSHDVRMDHDVATDNVSGFEIENSTNVRADHNEAFGNTGGILSFILPFLDTHVNANNRIDHNFVHDNNKGNTCAGGEVCLVPVGTGILLVSADANSVVDNVVTGNDSLGIAVTNFCVVTHLSPEECAGLDFEPNPDGNLIASNRLSGNGADPDPSIAPFPGADLLWDGTGIGNCWVRNRFESSFPSSLPCG
jgi:parallel beta-helix repeat protein